MTGCTPRTDCAALFDAIEPSLTEIRASLPPAEEQSPPLPTPAALRHTAAAYSRLAAALEHVELHDAEVKRRAESYRGYAADLAAGFETLAVALESEDEAVLETAREKLDTAASNEQVVWHNLDLTCRSR